MNRLAEKLTQAWLSRGFLAWCLLPFSALMWTLVKLRRTAYEHGWLQATRLPVPVIVVGNRIVGGAGKTPVTIAVIQHLQSRGLRPGVLTRGYKARQVEQTFQLLDDASECRLHASETGDEPMLIWRKTHVPVMIGRDRAKGGAALLSHHPEIDVLICDDGLQHLKLQRDIEIVVFDERGQGNGWLLPAGLLREPIHTKKTTGVVGKPLILYNASRPSTPLVGHMAQRRMDRMVKLETWWRDEQVDTPDSHSAPPRFGERVHAMAGIAQPQRFFDALKAMGYLVEGLPLPDHADFAELPWTDEHMDLVVTEKDAVKLEPSRVHRERPMTRVWVAGMSLFPEPAFWLELDQAMDRLHFRHTAVPLTGTQNN